MISFIVGHIICNHILFSFFSFCKSLFLFFFPWCYLFFSLPFTSLLLTLFLPFMLILSLFLSPPLSLTLTRFLSSFLSWHSCVKLWAYIIKVEGVNVKCQLYITLTHVIFWKGAAFIFPTSDTQIMLHDVSPGYETYCDTKLKSTLSFTIFLQLSYFWFSSNTYTCPIVQDLVGK